MLIKSWFQDGQALGKTYYAHLTNTCLAQNFELFYFAHHFYVSLWNKKKLLVNEKFCSKGIFL